MREFFLKVLVKLRIAKRVVRQKLYKGEGVELNNKIFGPGVRTTSLPVSFVFINGGMGDYINWAAAVEYVSKTQPHVDGRIYTSGLFLEVAKHLFGHLPRWRIENRDDFTAKYERGSLVAIPKPGTQLLNACGSHLMNLGFYYFCCTDPPPKEHNYLPEINYEGPWRWLDLDPDSRYAVFTPGATAGVRTMPVGAFNELVNYTLGKGITPVFLGKAELSEEYRATFLSYDFSKGIDLRERTTLLEATQVMRGAEFVLGLDNGLLHLAGTGKTPIIFGHNVTQIHHRDIRRRVGLTINITVSSKVVNCIGCQSRMRFIPKHDFRKCFFDENEQRSMHCLPALFKDGAAVWKSAIDKVLVSADKYKTEVKNYKVYVK